MVRRQLEDVSENKLGQNLSQQIAALERLGVKVIPEPLNWKNKGLGQTTININCYAYALNLAASDYYCKFIYENYSEQPNLFANSHFILYLINESLLQEVNEPSTDDIIIYFKNDKPTHAGIVSDNFDSIIKSKWGTFDGVFLHTKLHVPESYGSTLKYFKPIVLANAEKYFRNYIKNYELQNQ